MRYEFPVNIINLPHRTERRLQAEQQAIEQKFYARFWEGIVHPHDRKKGICLAHKQIVQNAKECGDKFCVIAEDDILFFKSEDGKLAWDYFLDNMPDEFSLYFSMIYVGVIKDNRIVSVFSGMTMYMISQDFYDTFLSLPDSCHIDRQLGLTANIHKYMVCPKFVCYQDGSRSDNNFMTCSYEPYLVGRKIYGKD